MRVVKEAVQVIQEVFDPTKHVAPRVQRMRLAKCMGCEHRIKLTNQCDLCWCFMSIKTRLKSKDCELRSEEYPEGKWQKEI